MKSPTSRLVARITSVLSVIRQKCVNAAQQPVVWRRSQLTTADRWQILQSAHVGCIGTIAEGQGPPTRSHRGGLHARSREPQKASQAHIALASRTALSRRRTNSRAYAALPE